MATTISLADINSGLSSFRRSSPVVRYQISRPTGRNIDELPIDTRFAALAGNRMVGQPVQWTEDRTQYVKQYKGSAYIAISAIARMIARQTANCVCKWRIEKKSGVTYEEMLPSDPLPALLENPNKNDTFFDLMYLLTGWYCITGDAYTYKARNGFGMPKRIYALPSQWMYAVGGEMNFIDSYRVYAPPHTDFTVDAENIIHMKNPSLDWSQNGRYYGHPSIKAAATSLELENEMWARRYFNTKNFVKPGLMVRTEQRLQPHQARQIWNQINAQISMAEHSGRAMILHSGMTAEPLDNSNELDFASSLDKALEYTLAVHGTPKAVVGLVQGMDKANVESAMWQWAKLTIDPLMEHFSQVLTKHLAQAHFGKDAIIHFGEAQIDNLDAIVKKVDTLIKAGGATPDEIRAEMMNWQPMPGGLGSKPVIVSGFGRVGESSADTQGTSTEVGRMALATPKGQSSGEMAR